MFHRIVSSMSPVSHYWGWIRGGIVGGGWGWMRRARCRCNAITSGSGCGAGVVDDLCEGVIGRGADRLPERERSLLPDHRRKLQEFLCDILQPREAPGDDLLYQ